MITSLHTVLIMLCGWAELLPNLNTTHYPFAFKPSLCWEKIWYYNLISLIIIIIIIIIIIEYSYSYYLIFFLENLFLDNSTL